MWLFPFGRQRPAVSLPPGRYPIPWYYTEPEVERLGLLLRELVRGVEFHLQLRADALPEALSPPPAGLDRALVVVLGATGETALQGLRSARYLLVQREGPTDNGYGWQERFVKPQLLTALRRHLEDPGHPLAPANVRGLPVTLAAGLTPDPLEMLQLLEATIGHRLRYAAEGLEDADWRRSLLVAAGSRLAERLGRLPDERLPAALEALLRPPPLAVSEGARALEAVGLARVMGASAALGPLARHVEEPPIWGELVSALPPAAWTDEASHALDRLVARRTDSDVIAPSTALDAPWLSPTRPPRLAPLLAELATSPPLRQALDAIALTDACPPFMQELSRPDRTQVTAALRVLADLRDGPERLGARMLAAVLRFRGARGPDMLEDQATELGRIEELADSLQLAAVLVAARQEHIFTLLERTRSRRDLDAAEALCVGTLALVSADSPAAAVLELQRGITARKQGRYDAACELVERALGHLGGRPSVESLGHRELGRVARIRGDYRRAADHFERARGLAADDDDEVGLAATHLGLGAVARDRDLDDVAEQWFRRALEVSERLGHEVGIARAAFELGMLELDRSAFERALPWLERSLSLSEAQSDRTGIARACHGLGQLAGARGAFDEAAELHRRALALAVELGDPVLEWANAHEMGNLGFLRRRHDEALGWYERARELAERVGYRQGLAGTLSQIGAVWSHRGDPARGLTHKLAGFETFHELGSPDESILLLWITEDREQLGGERFAELVEQRLPGPLADELLDVLEAGDEA